MALPTNTFATYEAIGNREDLSDMIYRIDPTDTPFMSGVEKEKATAVNHEWQTQALAAVDTANAQLEGDDATTDAATPRFASATSARSPTRWRAFPAPSRRSSTPAATTNSPIRRCSRASSSSATWRPILVGTNQAKVAGDTTTARKTASILSWITSNTVKGTAGGAADPAPVDGTGTRTDGTQRAFTEERLKTVLSSIWTNGGKPDTIMTGAFNKQVFSTFTGRASPIEETKSKKIMASVDAYEVDFGALKVVPNRFQRARDVLVLQMDKWAVAFLNGRNMISIPLAKNRRLRSPADARRIRPGGPQREGVRRRVRQHHVVTERIAR